MAATALHNLLRYNNTIGQKPLLRSPFTGAGHTVISSLKSGWAGPEDSSAQLKQIKELIIDGGIGGAFWQATPKLPSNLTKILVLPPDLTAARRLISTVFGHFQADSMAVFYPLSRALQPLLSEIATTAAHLAPLGNPHPILDVAQAVYGDQNADLTTLAALAGIPSFEFRENEFHKRSPEYIAAWIAEGTSYTNPFTGGRSEIEQIAEILGDWRRMFQRNRSIASCTGISLWKRKRMAQLLHNGESAPRFYRSANSAVKHAAEQGKSVAAWASRFPANLQASAQKQKTPLCRLEDGFIRSAGLGSNLTLPASIVTDNQGIYFDPARPSDLETLLQNTVFSESLRRRANRLIQLLSSKQISKYAAGGDVPAIHAAAMQRIILVPGQVADDFSLQCGTTGAIRSNMALLQAVRRHNPDAFIVYRPHPDVLAGHRAGAIANPVTLGFANQLIASGSIAALIGKVDEVHTMTSLAGFEALLRGRAVHVFGQPFYAGWGLTTDHLPVQRRQRRLQLEELVAGALILYPHYLDPATGLLCGPETLIARLEQPELWRPNLLMRLRRLHGTCRRMITRAAPYA